MKRQPVTIFKIKSQKLFCPSLFYFTYIEIDRKNEQLNIKYYSRVNYQIKAAQNGFERFYIDTKCNKLIHSDRLLEQLAFSFLKISFSAECINGSLLDWDMQREEHSEMVAPILRPTEASGFPG